MDAVGRADRGGRVRILTSAIRRAARVTGVRRPPPSAVRRRHPSAAITCPRTGPAPPPCRALRRAPSECGRVRPRREPSARPGTLCGVAPGRPERGMNPPGSRRCRTRRAARRWSAGAGAARAPISPSGRCTWRSRAWRRRRGSRCGPGAHQPRSASCRRRPARRPVGQVGLPRVGQGGSVIVRCGHSLSLPSGRPRPARTGPDRPARHARTPRCAGCPRGGSRI